MKRNKHPLVSKLYVSFWDSYKMLNENFHKLWSFAKRIRQFFLSAEAVEFDCVECVSSCVVFSIIGCGIHLRCALSTSNIIVCRFGWSFYIICCLCFLRSVAVLSSVCLCVFFISFGHKSFDASSLLLHRCSEQDTKHQMSCRAKNQHKKPEETMKYRREDGYAKRWCCALHSAQWCE